MEKLLAMSILSSTPSEIKSGVGSSWLNSFFRVKSNQDSNIDSKRDGSESKKKEEQRQNNSKDWGAAWSSTLPLSGKVASIFVPTVVLLALLTFIVWFVCGSVGAYPST